MKDKPCILLSVKKTKCFSKRAFCSSHTTQSWVKQVGKRADPCALANSHYIIRNRGASGLVQTNPSIPLHKWPVVYTERQIDRLINFPFLTFRLASKINFYDYLHAVLQVVHDLKLSFSHPLHPPTRNFIIYLFCNMCGMGSVFLTILSSISRFTFKLCDMGDCLP